MQQSSTQKNQAKCLVWRKQKRKSKSFAGDSFENCTFKDKQMQQYWHKYNFMQAVFVTKLTAFKVMFAIFPTGEVMLEGIIWTEFQWSNKAFCY